MTETHILEQLENLRGKLLKDEPLSKYTYFKTGGPADYVYVPADLDDLSCFLKQVPLDVPVTWLGLGSNLLIRDGGIPGVVIVTQGGLNKIEKIDEYEVLAEAGVSAAQLARYTARLSAAGLEFMAGIPGTVGGALAMNAGCFGGETWEYVKSVKTIDRAGIIRERMPEDYVIAYRSVTKPESEWFVAGRFQCRPGDKAESLGSIRELLERRSNTQPTGTANCGSVFRNPPGDYAGKLIEGCGLKGKRQGNAHVSEKHANFIISEKASSADIEALINDVRSIVHDQTGIELVPEVCIIGRGKD